MNLPTRFAHGVATNPWTLLISTIGSILGLGVLINDRFFVPTPTTEPIALFLLVTVIYVAVSGAALRILDDNRKLREVANNFREINSIYRDRLFSAFHGENPVKERAKLIDIEKITLTSVCQRISQIYSKLTGRNCVVTVKLLTKENDNVFVTTYARSENDSERDKASPKRFEVNTGQNTAFDEALMPNTTGHISHFYSGDLRKHKHYNNQRPSWDKCYQSTIVVPIRCLGVEGKSTREDIGFLCIDTKSRNRLNNSHHVVMMAALADQMYNFMSLMRGKYTVSVEGVDAK
ncbi:MAG: hypothetical protein H6981_05450 [Gammaproteobacteria bacterium]|nr:hypothetical protein [Gammaproteobacteria bacterium]MCP5136228.1 hypothetical protein [Gammaproteobacteria bacterium]